MQYEQLFALCQILPGSASTKMGICIVLMRDGFIPAMVYFATWRYVILVLLICVNHFIHHMVSISLGLNLSYSCSLAHLCCPSLPGALGMFGLAMGVSRMSATLPGPVYALLSGLNAAIVGIIALAGVQLAKKTICGPLTRLLVVGTGCAAICYNALWYLPVILIVDGMITLFWSAWSSSTVRVKFIERRCHCLNHSLIAARGPTGLAEEFASPVNTLVQRVKTENELLPRGGTQLEAQPPIAVLLPPTDPIGSPSTEPHDTDAQAPPQSPSLQIMSIKCSVALAVAFLRG